MPVEDTAMAFADNRYGNFVIIFWKKGKSFRKYKP